MAKTIALTVLSTTLTLAECTDGYWLYDKTRGMNLSIRATTPQEAFVGALTYYQRRLQEIEGAHASLSQKVDIFVSQFTEQEE